MSAATIVAAGPSLHHTHTLIAFIVVIGCLIVTMAPPLAGPAERPWKRPVFWSGVVGVTVGIFAGAIPYWGQAFGMAAFSLAFMIASAYAYTPYIKIGGKVHAFWRSDSGGDVPPDSYQGMVTARKHWWAQVFSVPLFGCLLLIQAPDKPWWLTPAAAAALVLASAGFGYIDASQGFPIARGQRLQFVILAVITAGAFTLLYLTGRQAGKRWPWRRGRSDDYGAHARRSENTP
jgi:hypothetical protein